MLYILYIFIYISVTVKLTTMHTGCYHGSILLKLECDSFLEMLDFCYSTILTKKLLNCYRNVLSSIRISALWRHKQPTFGVDSQSCRSWLSKCRCLCATDLLFFGHPIFIFLHVIVYDNNSKMANILLLCLQ